jgi:acyl transferase domain-containing protein/acyl carrier protein
MRDDDSTLDRAIAVIEQLQARLAVVEGASARTHSEPIAIVGMSCRMPASDTPEALWQLLDEGRDPIRRLAARGPFGGVVDALSELDASFFRLSPREAVSMDPRQRLILEGSWEALESAGIRADALHGQRVGVYVGASGVTSPLEPLPDLYGFTGAVMGAIAGRVSHVLGLQGPSMSVDTTCSSALVALHLACKALDAGECSLALAGGVAVQPRLDEEQNAAWAAVPPLGERGRCQTFDAGADGIVLSDGCGVLVLKRLSVARRDGDRILALIRGSALSHDGGGQGFTVPNPAAQEAVIRRALEDARIGADKVGYVECHGTGTPLGDPIEVQALSQVYGATRREPLVLGSVKSNIGHTDAAAGVAGVLKVVLALRHERIPKNLHFKEPNPHIPWSELPVKVASESVPWPRGAKARFAGVSSFGMSGTNVHVVLEEAPAEAAVTPAPERSAELVVLSAKSADALRASADRLAAQVERRPEHGLGDVAYSLATTRTHHEHRLSLVVRSREELIRTLRDAHAGEVSSGGSRFECRSGKTAWLFTGQGSQRVGMGKELAEAWPVFREALAEAMRALDAHLELPLRDVMWAEPGTEHATRLGETEYAQPALFALGVGLAALWRSWGVRPDYVMGHSVGELTAAHVAGVLTLSDAAKLVAARGRLMQRLPEAGAMVSLAATEAEVAKALLGHEGRVSIAAVNGPESTVISGAEDAVMGIAEVFASRGIRTKRLEVSHAFHSPLMEPMLEEFRRVAESVPYGRAEMPLVSNVSGKLSTGEVSTAAYWVGHVRAAVRFADGVQTLHASGVKRYVELGPKATLLGLVPSCVVGASEPEELLLVPSLRAERSESAVLEALGALHAHGASVNFQGVFPDGGRRVELPTYAWQRERYALARPPAPSRGFDSTGHPLLGERVSVAGTGAHAVFESVLSRTKEAWLYDHAVGDRALMPGAGLAELIRAAGEQVLEGESVEVTGLSFQSPLVLPEHGGQRVQVVVKEEEDGRFEVGVYSQEARAKGDAPFTLHATGDVRRASDVEVATLDVPLLRERCTESLDVADAYEAFASVGLRYGPMFRGLRRVWRGQGEVLAELGLPESADGAERYGVHPALLDAAFQGSLGLGSDEGGGLALPFAIERLRVVASGAGSALVHVRRVAGDAGASWLDLTLLDAQGRVLVEVEGFRSRPVEREARGQVETQRAESALYRVGWAVAKPSSSAALSGRWVVVSDADDETARGLAARLEAMGVAYTRVEVATLEDAMPAEQVVCVWSSRQGEEVAEAARRMATEGLAVVQVLAKQGKSARLWWVTRGAVERHVDIGASSIWGLGRTMRQEHPELACKLIDIDDGVQGVEELALELGVGDDEPEVARHGSERRVARLERAGEAATANAARALRTDGTVLITGGLGVLGLHAARWLAKRGVKHLVLAGRRGRETPGAEAAVAELEGLGVQATVATVDASDRASLAAALAAIPEAYPLRGVIHTAGALDDGVLMEQRPSRFLPVMAPKVDGAWHLHELTKAADLDVFLLYSSISGTLGSGGQGSYAAANTFLDALAASRRSQGLAGQSLAWGLWVDESKKASGLASHMSVEQQARAARGGLGGITPSLGEALLEASVGLRDAQLVAAPIRLPELRKAFATDVPPLWRALVHTTAQAGRTKRAAWAEELAALPAEQRRTAVLEVVRGEVARALSMPNAGSVRDDRPLTELGLDSLMAVELRNALGRRAGTTLPATLAFDYPTPAAIASYLLEKVLSVAEAVASRSTPALGSMRAHPHDEAIAIIGLGCRFPGGADDAGSFWRMLDAGVDAVTEVPSERWAAEDWYDPDPDAAGKTTSRWGSFLKGLDRFDPAFFDISPREALGMDPQLRLMLETTWEALEDAGLVADQLMGSDTAVFMGLMGNEYLRRTLTSFSSFDIHGPLGSSPPSMVQRISYWLGLKGANMPVDTQCSSSLLAAHLACHGLRSGECSLALAGGANVTLDPESFVIMSRFRALSPTGRCHTFSADADGYVRSEGAGVVVLERLSDARRNGHRVLGVIRGSAVNQDGRSNGLTAPNGPSQEAVIREALRRAGVAPSSIDYLECHGTGTPLGDPLEVQAAAAVLGEGRNKDRPLVLGSLKSNIGHSEGAAGVGGLIKAVLALRHERIPKSLHFKEPNPHIPWSELPVKVASESVPWPRGAKARFAGVSSFGMSGTNVHVVLEEAPAEVEVTPAPERSAELVVLSAKSAEALRASADRLAAQVERRPEHGLGDVAYSLATTRTHHEHRLSLVVRSREELTGALQLARKGEVPVGSTRAEARSGGTAWLFTGQGSQRVGMGKELAEAWPVFREAFDAALRAFDAHLEVPLRAAMWAEAGTAEAKRLGETEYAQPALFALGVGLAALWRSWGIRPDYVMGHSVGELTAAHVAGVLTLSDAAKLVAARGRLMQRLPEAGAMVSVAATEAEVAKALAGSEATVAIAAVNGPESTVISGAEDAVMRIAEGFASRGIRTKRLEVSHAFHSPLMEPMLEEFRRVAESVPYGRAELPLVSNVSGTLSTGEVSTAAYWVGHVRAAVRFADGVQTLHASGVKRYVELGPKATLLGLVPSCVVGASEREELLLVPSLRAERSEDAAALEALGALHAHGASLDWKGVFPSGGRRVELPTYAWQRERYWLERPLALARGFDSTGHPLLGERVPSAGTGAHAVFESVLSRTKEAWLYDHAVGDRALMPGAGLAELIRAAGEQVLEGESVEVTGLSFQSPLVLPERGGQRVQVVVKEEEDGRFEVGVYSQEARAKGDAPFTLHATGDVRRASDVEVAILDVPLLRERCTESLDVADAYEAFASVGLRYGPMFRGLRRVWRGHGEVLAELGLPESADGAERYGVHPALLDAAFQGSLGLGSDEGGGLALPFAIERLRVVASGAGSALVHVRRVAGDAGASWLDLTLLDAQGHVLVEVEGFRSRPVEREARGQVETQRAESALYRVGWAVAKPSSSAALSGRWVVVSDADDETARGLAARLEAMGVENTRVEVTKLEDALPAEQVVCIWSSRADEAVPEAARRMATEGLAVVQVLAKQGKSARLWWVTRGAVSVSGEPLVDVGASSVWGLGRTVAHEHPELACTLIDVEASVRGIEELAIELGLRDDEREVARHGGGRRVARLERANESSLQKPKAANDTLEAARALRTDGTVLITGGLGALGLHAARWLAKRGVKHLVLAGRRGRETPGAEAAVAELEGLGVQATVTAVDASDRASLAAALAAVPEAYPLRGVIHTAGALDDGVLMEQRPSRFLPVMAPKVDGAWHLHELTKAADLDVFLLYSSISGTLGSGGQGSYAAANTFLDALAASRRSQGLAGQSLAWGLWVDESKKASGLASHMSVEQQARAARGGLGGITPSLGEALLEASVGLRDAQLVATPLRIPELRKAFAMDVPPLWRALVHTTAQAGRTKRAAWAEELAALPAEQRRTAVLEVVRGEVARALSMPNAGSVRDDRPLTELGLDSLMAVELRNALGRRAGTTLPATLAFDYPTPAAIASYLFEKMFGALEAAATEVRSLESVEQMSDQDLVNRLAEEFDALGVRS